MGPGDVSSGLISSLIIIIGSFIFGWFFRESLFFSTAMGLKVREKLFKKNVRYPHYYSIRNVVGDIINRDKLNFSRLLFLRQNLRILLFPPFFFSGYLFVFVGILFLVSTYLLHPGGAEYGIDAIIGAITLGTILLVLDTIDRTIEKRSLRELPGIIDECEKAFKEPAGLSYVTVLEDEKVLVLRWYYKYVKRIFPKPDFRGYLLGTADYDFLMDKRYLQKSILEKVRPRILIHVLQTFRKKDDFSDLKQKLIHLPELIERKSLYKAVEITSSIKSEHPVEEIQLEYYKEIKKHRYMGISLIFIILFAIGYMTFSNEPVRYIIATIFTVILTVILTKILDI